MIKKHRSLKDNENKKQIKLWSDLIKLMQIKNEIFSYNDKNNQEMKEKRNQTKDFLSITDN